MSDPPTRTSTYPSTLYGQRRFYDHLKAAGVIGADGATRSRMLTEPQVKTTIYPDTPEGWRRFYDHLKAAGLISADGAVKFRACLGGLQIVKPDQGEGP